MQTTNNLKAQLTFLEDPKLTDFHNHIMTITKKGIAHNESDLSINLENRWRYSQQLAEEINRNYNSDKKTWQTLKLSLAHYFERIEKENIKDQWILNYSNGKKPIFALRLLMIIIGLPFFIVGCFHHLVPYLFIKKFTENTFKRRVFWSGIKLILGYFILAVFNIALCFIVNAYFDIVSPWILWGYIIFIVPFLGLFAYWLALYTKDTVRLLKISKKQYESWHTERKKCVALISETIKID